MLDWALNLQFNHAKTCTSGQLYVVKENRKAQGLLSTIVFNCTMCSAIFEFHTENHNKTVSDINYGAVWGTLSTGKYL